MNEAYTNGDRDHIVQFYDDESFLFETVGRFIDDGLKSDDCVVVIATKSHLTPFLERVGTAVAERAIHGGRLILLDAEQTLSRFMVGDVVDADLFRDFLGGTMANVGAGRDGGRIRAYGEMVDVLWKDGCEAAAVRLEMLWNQLANTRAFSLLCGYSMGSFYKDAAFDDICRQHTHVVSTDGVTATVNGRTSIN